MTDIIAFISARLDEDEAAAVRAARPEPWMVSQPPRPDWYVQFWADPDCVAVVADPESSAYPVVASLACHGEDDEDLAEGRVEHIARHDPARVLAEVKAKRAILAEHAQVRSDVPGPYGYTIYGCTVCDAGCQCYPEVNKFGTEGCTTVRLMAAIYAEHPDYNPAWRVDA